MMIWLIDDNPDDRLLILRSLRRAFPAALFREIRNAAELEEALRGEPPDVVLVDYRLHWTDGLQILRLMRNRSPYVPVLMVTDTGNEEVAVEGMRLGLADYVLKAHLTRLPVAIEEALNRAQIQQERDRALQELARSEARHRVICELISDFVYEAVREGKALRFLWVGGRLGSALALDPDRLTQAGGLEPWIEPEDRERWGLHLQRLFEGEQDQCELRLQTPDGSVCWIRHYGRLERDGSLLRLYGAAQDITLQRRALEVEQEARRQAEEMNRLKSTFLASMSHEIRTPMNGILGFAELLREELTSLDRPDLVEFVDVIERSGHRLLRLLNDVLDLSRIEAGRLELEIGPHKLAPIVEQAAGTIRARAHQKGIKLIVQVPEAIVVLADEGRLYQVLLNVLSNAVKFTDAGFVQLTASAEGTEAVIRVQDTGVGIDPEFLPRIFEPFTQESTGWGRRFEGSGLGLAISKRLLELMGGRIAIHSQKGTGTTVEIRLPAASEAFERSASERAEADPQEMIFLQQSRPLIWLIEDDPASIRLIEEFPRGWAQLEWAPDGQGAFQLCERAASGGRWPDGVLMDLHLPPPWEGTLLYQEMRTRWPALARVPFIAQTAYSMEADRDRVLKAGFAGYLSKPVTRAALVHVLAQALGFRPQSG